ncbi:MAG: diguanylate cyclase [Clostridium sp.]|nr:diguanylate cyclase [Clostridium sp.]MCM1399129.1 diguanylate cyclase [Clostridium sp.]MCM1459521.1 diguanylate cyclase [Bacteroides sp.]
MDSYVKGNPTKEEMAKQLNLDAALMECVKTLYASDDVNTAINELLQIIADFHDADRAYIFEFDKEMLLMDNTYEWCKDGVEPQIDVLQNLDIHIIDRWFKHFDEKGEFFISSRVGEISEESDEYKILAMQDISSLMAAPLYLKGKMLGFLGVDNPNKNTETLYLLRSVSAFVVNDIERRVTLEQKMIEAIAGIYVSMHVLNLKDNTQREFQSTADVRRFVNQKEHADRQMRQMMTELTDPAYVDVILKFTDLSTLNERMKDVNIISEELLAKNGHWCRAHFILVSRDDLGNLKQVIYAIQYIDEEKKRELAYQDALKQALENKNEIYSEMLQMQSSGIIAMDIEKRELLMVNNAALKLFGFSDRSELGGGIDRLTDKIVSGDRKKITKSFMGLTEVGDEYICEYTVPNNGNENGYTCILSQSRVVVIANGDKINITSLTDVTEKKKMEQKLIVLSQTDSLTKINNRGSGEYRIEAILKGKVSGMFCLCDVDKFKSVNDTYGHTVGDKVLIEIAGCLKRSFGSGDVIMRLGGDEFAVFVVGVCDEETGKNCIERFFGELAKITIEEMEGKGVRVSLGAVIHKKENRETFDQLYQKADTAMYVCKNDKNKQFDFYKQT